MENLCLSNTFCIWVSIPIWGTILLVIFLLKSDIFGACFYVSWLSFGIENDILHYFDINFSHVGELNSQWTRTFRVWMIDGT